MDAEVFVVDNHSVDGSIEMIQEFYPQVKLIANKDNVGFSKANNQAILASKGEYVLLLNPDTVVEEDTFIKCVDFMDSHEDAGAMGVKLIDGKGKFLPESKRGLPTPKVAFYKISGISRLFPRSSQFGKYHMGHLPENETNSIEVLSGAFMFIRRKALDQAGLLDEDFFMYGEDTEWSLRLGKQGFKHFFTPNASVVHAEGGSFKIKAPKWVQISVSEWLFIMKYYGKLTYFFIALINLTALQLDNYFLRKLIKRNINEENKMLMEDFELRKEVVFLLKKNFFKILFRYKRKTSSSKEFLNVF
jgi:GT2 family glycosyltransferase